MNNVIVLFEVTIKKGKTDDYLKTASLLKDSLKNAKGFIKSERFSSLNNEGKLLSMSIWEDEESVKNWRNLEAHRTAQKHGIMSQLEIPEKTASIIKKIINNQDTSLFIRIFYNY